jgi:hypothetical protein
MKRKLTEIDIDLDFRHKKSLARYSTRTFLLVLLLVNAASVTQAGQDRNLEAALAAVEKAKSIDDLLNEARSAPYNTAFVREGVWYAAAVGSWNADFAANTSLQQRVSKALVFATVLELASQNNLAKWPKDETLFVLGPPGLNALKQEGNFGREEPLNAMLQRRPEIRNDWHGYYRYLRVNNEFEGYYLLSEQSDTPWGDLTREPKTTRKALSLAVNKSKISSEFGLSYKFPLEAMNHMIVAGKTYLCLQLLPKQSPYRRYLQIVAGNLFYFASEAAGPDIALAAEYPLKEAINSLRDNPVKHGTLLTADNLQPRLTATKFFGRRLRAALEDYRVAANALGREPAYRLYGEWGTGICLLGLVDRNAVLHFRNVAESLRQNSPKNLEYRYMLSTLYEVLGPGEVLSSDDQHRELIVDIESWRKGIVGYPRRHSINLDLLRILVTINRYDAAARLLMREIREVHSHREAEFRVIERHYLRELGASLNDAFAALSWKIDDEGISRARSDDKREWSRDFAPAIEDRPGLKYGTVSPEEDRATCVTPYLVARAKQAALGREVIQWVTEGLSQVPPNVKPLLKIAWVEWFFLPFTSLDDPNPNVSAETWRYKPGSDSGYVSSSSIERELARFSNNVDKETRRVWNTFQDANRFLIANYDI